MKLITLLAGQFPKACQEGGGFTITVRKIRSHRDLELPLRRDRRLVQFGAHITGELRPRSDPRPSRPELPYGRSQHLTETRWPLRSPAPCPLEATPGRFAACAAPFRTG